MAFPGQDILAAVLSKINTPEQAQAAAEHLAGQMAPPPAAQAWHPPMPVPGQANWHAPMAAPPGAPAGQAGPSGLAALLSPDSLQKFQAMMQQAQGQAQQQQPQVGPMVLPQGHQGQYGVANFYNLGRAIGG